MLSIAMYGLYLDSNKDKLKNDDIHEKTWKLTGVLMNKCYFMCDNFVWQNNFW